ncbi:protein involved in polysaccharide export with SLBB domain [Silvibacterium bohemicum]|uniref:Protein involved in polysaccharide export with SLBB domain n=1 Tax=Silvibacterium bohemicum TaxID=1577686 RepID=A0A841K3S3_9BACT|nr:SLBB domain-containing protein [Silvibacterium bohemicum]MBB6146589.1 protein involved in polysaccharide export with SLBB domain [Silvibacterium bohemicum]
MITKRIDTKNGSSADSRSLRAIYRSGLCRWLMVAALTLSFNVRAHAQDPLMQGQQQNSQSQQFPGSISSQQFCNDFLSPCTSGSGQGGVYSTQSPFQTAPVPTNTDLSGPGFTTPQSTDPSQALAPASTPAPAVQRKAEHPTEFQIFVAGAVGKLLPIYGHQLFVDAPSTFAPLDKGPVTSNYVVGPGDELMIHAWGSVSFNVRQLVDRSGNIFLPHFGSIRVAGLHSSELNQFLSDRIGKEFRQFDISVTLGQLRSIQVLVVGRAYRPGSYTLSALSTLVNALFASGGPSSTGSLRAIELRRDGKVITTLDLYQLIALGDESNDAPLLPGDVIYIPPAGPRIAVAGSVNQPAIYEIHDGDTVSAAIKLAAGTTSIAALQRAELERIDSDGERHVIDLKLSSDQMQTPLHDGDVLRVFQLAPKFDNAVILRGNVANPGRYAWHEGMRIRDLIPSKESLITRDALNSRNALALTDDERTHANRIELSSRNSNMNDNAGMQSGSSDNNQDSQTSGTPPPSSGDAAKTNQASQTGSSNQNTPPTPSQMRTMPASPEDQVPSSSTSTGRSISFDLGRPSEEFPRKNLVDSIAPEINWDYAVIQRVNPTDMRSVLKSFHLGRVVLDHDDSENYELQPGDVVTIFSQADLRVPDKHQRKFVRLEGEFGASGIYSVEPGETLRDLVARAGGLTPDAYLFGSFFTRRSTRLQQQSMLDQYTVDLEKEIDREAGNSANDAITPQEAAVSAVSVENRRALLVKLRQVQATGRIVLSLEPGSNDISSLPDMPLEDGDVFVVPTRPASVSVVGAVYDQNSFLFAPRGDVEHYLQLSGGVTKNGDWKHSFLLRADGSVVSHTSLLARSDHGLEHFNVNPGDSLIIPEQFSKSTWMRGLTDWSSIFAQFGLGAAAVSVLK